PTLIMAGDEEEPCLEACLLMKRTIPTAGLAILPKSGHGINLEEPALFNRLLEEFFHQVESGRWGARDRGLHLRPLRQAVSTGQLTVEKRGAVGWIVFDSPAKRNAINGAMWRGIPDAMAAFDADPQVRCVAFRGAGTAAFSAGADISEFDRIRSQDSAVAEYDDLLDRVLHSIQDSRKPSLAMIHGFCMGGGLEIALACDLRYCGESGQFGIPAAKLGLAYNVEGHKRLLETVGHARAREIMFLGRRYDAAEALAMGLVHEVVADAGLEAFVEDLLKNLCQNAPLAIANSKTIIEEYVKAAGQPDQIGRAHV